MAYEFPWWESVGVDAGRSVTDLPVRQCLLLGHGQGARRRPTTARRAARQLRRQTERRLLGRARASSQPHAVRARRIAHRGDPGSQEWHDAAAPRRWSTRSTARCASCTTSATRRRPYAAAYIDWGSDPFGGGVNFWNVGARSWEVDRRRSSSRSADMPVYICGEAYSNGQGWVEGALETAEMVLQQHLGLEAPTGMGDVRRAGDRRHRVRGPAAGPDQGRSASTTGSRSTRTMFNGYDERRVLGPGETVDWLMVEAAQAALNAAGVARRRRSTSCSATARSRE